VMIRISCREDSMFQNCVMINKDGDGDASFQLKSDSLPHAHAQTTKKFYKHQDSRIMKAQELKTKISAQTHFTSLHIKNKQLRLGDEKNFRERE
ncbi:hypothetical protein Tco_1277968, partial [Tanacetum coccineum]